MRPLMRTLSDFKITILAVGCGMLAILVADAFHLIRTHAVPLLLLISLCAFIGLFSDFQRLKKRNADIAREQRELLLQATMLTMADTTHHLKQDLQQLYQQAEQGQLPDIQSLGHLQHLLDVHVTRLQQLGEASTVSVSWSPRSGTRVSHSHTGSSVLHDTGAEPATFGK